jgi:membrane fusion protein, multidrug efflux system
MPTPEPHTPPVSRSGRRKWWIGLLLVLLMTAVAGWVLQRRASAPSAPSTPSAPKTSPSPATVDVPVRLADSDLLSAGVQTLTQILPISGSIQAQRTAFIKARQAGEIRQVLVREGDAVKVGQLLVSQDSEEAGLRLKQAEEQAKSAQAQLAIARRNLENNRALVKQGFVSETALDSTLNNEQAATAALQSAQAAVDLARKAVQDTQLVSPMAGVVSQRLAQPGERVSVDARILEVIDLGSLELQAAVPASDVLTIRVGQTVALQLEGTDLAISGRIARLAPSAATGSRAVTVYATLQRHPALRQGLFAQGQVTVAQFKALAVPRDVIRLDRAQPYVLVLRDGRIQSQIVKLGRVGRGANPGAGEWVEVVEGLREGDRVGTGRLGGSTEGRQVQQP